MLAIAVVVMSSTTGTLEDLLRIQYLRHYFRSAQDNRKLEDMIREFPEGFYMMSTMFNPKTVGIRIPALNNKEVFIMTWWPGERIKLGRRFSEVRDRLPEELAVEFEGTLMEMASRPMISIDKEVIQCLIKIHDIGMQCHVIEYIKAVKNARSHPWVGENAFLWTRPVLISPDSKVSDEVSSRR